MRWINKINNVELALITGDGKRHTPLWKNAKKNLNFNTEGFDFVGNPCTSSVNWQLGDTPTPRLVGQITNTTG